MAEALPKTLISGMLLQGMLSKGTGSLALRHPQGEQGQLYFEEGCVVHVSLGSHRDVRAMALLLNWQEGSYAFRPTLTTPTLKTMRSSIERLLLEAVMHADVSKKKGHNPFYEDSILAAKPLQKDQVVSVSLRAVQLLPHLDGLRTLGEIAKSISQGPGMSQGLADVVTAANELHQQGLTENKAITITSEFVGSLEALVLNIMGPMGEIIVHDALYDLGVSAQALPKRVIPALLRQLENEMQHLRWREQFDQGARQLCQHYGVAITT
jgi:Domain of unknown function (DUF4388)